MRIFGSILSVLSMIAGFFTAFAGINSANDQHLLITQQPQPIQLVVFGLLTYFIASVVYLFINEDKLSK